MKLMEMPAHARKNKLKIFYAFEKENFPPEYLSV